MKLWIATLYVGTMRGKSAEIVEMLSQCKIVDICCMQETHWKGKFAGKIMGKICHFKFFWKGDESGDGGIGILIKEKWSEPVLSISRVNPCIMMLKMLIKTSLVSVTCVNAPQVGLSNHEKDAFYERLLTCVSSVGDSEIHIISGDFDGDVVEVYSLVLALWQRLWHKKFWKADDIRPVWCDWSCSF